MGYEFYENRINVISEYEKSYDEILSVLENAKSDIETKYKDHPFLNLKEINKKVKQGLSGTETAIKKAKTEHPKWLENDEVLEKINILFKGNIGKIYDKQKLDEIKCEGEKRYNQKIPPGFKDSKKPENKKFGDLILWYQIIDKAKESKKPIIFISGDVKEDWWLEKDGKRILPLPQLKKEMYDKANVDFHIYTADRFLKLSETEENKIDEKTIKEVRKIRELEENRAIIRRRALMEQEREFNPRMFEKYSIEYIHLFDNLENLMMEIDDSNIHSAHLEELMHMFHRARSLRNRLVHGNFDKISVDKFYKYTKEIVFILDKIIHSREIHPKLHLRMREFVDRLEYLNHRLRRLLI